MASQRTPEPGDGDERAIVLGWLTLHRDALAAKCAGLTPDQLAHRAVAPSALSLIGIVRPLVEMEHVYGAWAIGGPRGEYLSVWGEYRDGGPEWDFDAEPASDAGNGRTLRWSLLKLIGEYARHNGHADLLRERIDGVTGE